MSKKTINQNKLLLIFLAIAVVGCVIFSVVLFKPYLGEKMQQLSKVKEEFMKVKENNKIRYVALGDSYSNGQSVSEKAAWPKLLEDHLQKTGHNVKLVANPSITGWTTQNLIEGELPEFILAKPTFATLMIGANDVYQEIDEKVFHKNLIKILDEMQNTLPDKKNIILVTIPDYSVTPLVKTYPNVKQLQQSVQKFNSLIKEEAKNRDLKVVDIFKLSQAMGEDASLVAEDGLHPSEKELAVWEKEVFSVASSVLK